MSLEESADRVPHELVGVWSVTEPGVYDEGQLVEQAAAVVGAVPSYCTVVVFQYQDVAGAEVAVGEDPAPAEGGTVFVARSEAVRSALEGGNELGAACRQITDKQPS